jgi:hypothetical protein
MKRYTILAALLLAGTAHAHICDELTGTTTIDDIRQCMDWRHDVVVESNSCTAGTADELRSCVSAGGSVSITADITVSSCPAVIDVQGKTGVTINGNGHTILRTSVHRQCSLVDVRNSSNVSINDLTLDDDSRVRACVVGDNCPRMVHVRDSSRVSFDSVDIANGKGYVVYTSAVRGFTFKDGSLHNSGVLGMYIGHGSTPSTDVVISGSMFTGNSTNALAVLGASNVQITGNTFLRNHNRGQWPVAPQFGYGMTGGGQVYIARASNVLIEGNTITDGSCSNCRGGIHGIELSEPNKTDSVRDVTITGNEIARNTGQPIYTNAGSRVDGLVVDTAAVTPEIPAKEPAKEPANVLKVEAESVPLSVGWINRGDHIEWIGPTEYYLLSQRKDESNLTYTFQVPKAGKYRLNMRARTGTIFNAKEPGNDFWLQLPGKPWIKVWFNRDGNWHEDAIGEQGATKSRELLDMTLPAGPVTITLSGRSRGAVIDYLTLEPQGFEVGSVDKDLLILNYDSWPDQDDHQAVLMAAYIVDKLNLNPFVVVGAHGENNPHLSFIPGSQYHWRSVFPATLDAYTKKDQSVETVAILIAEKLRNGGKVSIAEGGPSDFTARVLRYVLAEYPAADLKRISVYQHSTGATAFNEAKTLPANLAFVKQRTTYVPVPNGNIGGNGSADFQEPASSPMCQRFMQQVLTGPYAAQWQRAYSIIGDARKCDASDAVELLAIVGDKTTLTFDDFLREYVR